MGGGGGGGGCFFGCVGGGGGGALAGPANAFLDPKLRKPLHPNDVF